ncbi:MAG: hypothetical protein IJZ42_10705 [Lachnospiraceae bacterium]|nr:hypothetical protein [Lachnospiraceae bacterium]
MNKPKKIINCLIIGLLFFANSINVFANEIEKLPIKTGYLDEGTYYEVYSNEFELCADAEKSVQIKVTYEQISKPQETLSWTEEIDGYTYTGVLNLTSYSFIGNKTIAIYQGTLYLQ